MGATRGIDPDDIYSIAVWAIIGGIVGARLVHVVDNWSFYQANPGQVIAIWSGGIGLWGGILGGFITGALYALWRRHPVGIIADLTAPALLFAQTIGRLGDIVNGEHCAKAWISLSDSSGHIPRPTRAAARMASAYQCNP